MSKSTGHPKSRYIKKPDKTDDKQLTSVAESDPDSGWLTDEEWEVVKPRVRRGRPPATVTKERISIRLSPEVLSAFRATGPGWQTRINQALEQWLQEQEKPKTR